MILRASVPVMIGMLSVLAEPTRAQGPATEGLAAYLAHPDASFAWEVTSNDTTEAGTVYSFRFVSQNWRGGDWSHLLRVYEPKELKNPNLMLLFITGGSSRSVVKPEDHVQGFSLANACGSRVAVLPQVPNQPLLGDRFEDDLIGETFVKYLETQEGDWPLLFPMVKSAVQAMNALQAWGQQRGKPVEGFVVTGASKRGWTTWLTGAMDRRVKAIAPMVIPTLNMKAQTRHQLESWGKYSEQIEDYTRRGLTEKFDDPVGSKLWRMVDPYSYLDRITVPVLQINGTNDRYWTLDSMNLFWDDIRAPKGVVYLPNAGHGLDVQRDWAIHAVGALVRTVAAGEALPAVETRVTPVVNGKMRLEVISSHAPKSVQLWEAASETRDFRESKWTARTDSGSGSDSVRAVYTIALPENGFAAAFADLTFEVDGLTYHLSTPIRILGSDGEIKPRVLATR